MENLNIHLDEDLTNQMTVNKNLSQEIIVTNTDKVTILLNEHHKIIKRKLEWLSPVSIFFTVFATLLTAKFDETVIGISPTLWKAIFFVVCVLSLLLSLYFISTALRFIRRGSVEEFINKLKNVNSKPKKSNRILTFIISIFSSKKKIIIHSARYGANETFLEVTSLLNSSIENGKLNFVVNKTNIGSDPVPNVAKQLIVDFSYNGEKCFKSITEGGTFVL